MTQTSSPLKCLWFEETLEQSWVVGKLATRGIDVLVKPADGAVSGVGMGGTPGCGGIYTTPRGERSLAIVGYIAHAPPRSNAPAVAIDEMHDVLFLRAPGPNGTAGPHPKVRDQHCHFIQVFIAAPFLWYCSHSAATFSGRSLRPEHYLCTLETAPNLRPVPASRDKGLLF